MITEARRRVVDLARATAGLGAATERARYAALVAPGETARRAADMVRMSGCALVVRGLWRSAGIRHPRLDTPYRIGMAVADVVQIAREAGAVRHPRTAPHPGDVVLVGGIGSGPEHVYTVLRLHADDWPTNGGVWLEALDGGQRDAMGEQLVRLVDHEIIGDPPRDGARPVRCVIDYGALWARFGRAGG